MTKFRITHANAETTDVDADQYNLKNGYFDFTSYDGDLHQILSIKESAVIKVEKID